MSTLYFFIIGCGFLAIIYGLVSIRSVLAMGTGTKEMQRIAAAIQEGANAYLKRQYQMITLVGIVICAALTWILGMHVGAGFLIGAVLSGVAG